MKQCLGFALNIPTMCSDTQSCLTLCDPMDCSPPGFSVHGIIQARTLRWVAISLSSRFSQPRDWTHNSCISRQILYHWAAREAHPTDYICKWWDWKGFNLPVYKQFIQLNNKRKQLNWKWAEDINRHFSALATGLKKVSFHTNPKGNAKECSNYHTIAPVSHIGKLMLKMLPVRLQ